MTKLSQKCKGSLTRKYLNENYQIMGLKKKHNPLI